MGWCDVFGKVSLNNFARLRYGDSRREMAHDKQWRSLRFKSASIMQEAERMGWG